MTVVRVAGKYELLRPIGRGGMGEVHLARLEGPRGVRKLVALKMALDTHRASQAALFEEARLAALIVHPHVAQLFDVGMEGPRAWFTMEYVSGPSLAELLALPQKSLPPWTWARIFADACAALHAVHEARDENGAPLNVVHRDITPQNLLVGWDGVCKLVDFGIARSTLRSAPTTTGVVRGKLGYMSPEQAGGEQVDRRSDIFAVGVLMWEAISGRRLFARASEAETLASILRGDVIPLSRVAPDAPIALATIVERALQRDAAARFSDALEVRLALERALCSSQVVVGANEVSHVLSALPLQRERKPQSAHAPARTAERKRSSSAAPQSMVGGPRAIRGWLTRSRGFAFAAVALAIATAWAAARSTSEQKGENRPAPRLEASSHNQATSHTSSPQATRPARTQVAPLQPTATTPAPAPAASRETLLTRQPTVSEHRAAAQRAKHVAEVPSPSPSPPSTSPSPSPPSTSLSPSPPSTSLSPSHPSAPALANVGAGTLNVIARPVWASIVVDGEPRGSTPLVISNLRAGPHVVEAAPLGKAPVERRTVTVQPNAVQRVEFQLREPN